MSDEKTLKAIFDIQKSLDASPFAEIGQASTRASEALRHIYENPGMERMTESIRASEVAMRLYFGACGRAAEAARGTDAGLYWTDGRTAPCGARSCARARRDATRGNARPSFAGNASNRRGAAGDCRLYGSLPLTGCNRGASAIASTASGRPDEGHSLAFRRAREPGLAARDGKYAHAVARPAGTNAIHQRLCCSIAGKLLDSPNVRHGSRW